MIASALSRRPHLGSELRLWLRFWMATAAVAQVSVFVLRPPAGDVLVVASLAVLVPAVVAVGGIRLDRDRLLGRLWPVLVSFTAVGIAGAVSASDLGPVLGGFFILGFVFVGLTHSPGVSFRLVPVAGVSWLLANQPLSHADIARLPGMIGVWLLVAELLARVSAERTQQRRVLAYAAATDPLTGLHNRQGLDSLLADRPAGDAVVVIDIDYFKRINDKFGHAEGDRVLVDFARVVLAVLRPGDVAIRYGGEEILLLLRTTDRAGIDACLDRLRLGWSASHPEVTFSAGAAVVGAAGADQAVVQADAALYRAKANGRNRTEHAAPHRRIVLPGPAVAGAVRRTG